jgi:hypothetical protein
MSLPGLSSARVRGASSVPRRRATDPQPRRRDYDSVPPKGHLGAFTAILIAVLFLGYFFNEGGIATSINTLFAGSSSSSGAKTNALIDMAAPLLGLVVAALILTVFVRWCIYGSKSFNSTSKLSRRPVISLDRFRGIADEHGVDAAIATKTYQLLLPFYQRRKRARMDERLLEDLHMTNAQVGNVFANLLRNAGEKEKFSGSKGLPATVLQMMLSVQNAASDSLENSDVRSAASPLSKLETAREMSGEMISATA